MGIHFLISDHVWGIGIEQKTPPAYWGGIAFASIFDGLSET
jgi:hypothetical protein